MANKVLLKKSSTAAKVPLVTDLDYGELAINYADGKQYYKTSGNVIDTFASISATATLTNKTLSSATLTGTLTAGGSAGTNGQVLQSTGSGVQWVAAGGTGTVTSITAGTGLSGGTITTTGTISIDSTVVTLTGSQTLTNKTLTTPVINNIKMGYTTTVTAAGTTTLTASSNFRQIFTGTTTQTIVLPVTSTLVTGIGFEIENNSTGNLTVNSSGGNQVTAVLPGTTLLVTCIGTTLTTAADWDADFVGFSGLTGTGSAVLGNGPFIISPELNNATLTGSLTAGSSTGTSGQVLQSTGTGVQWATPAAAGYSGLVEIAQTGITTSTTLSTVSATTYRGAKYTIQITNSTAYAMYEFMVMHDGTDVYFPFSDSAYVGDSSGNYQNYFSGDYLGSIASSKIQVGNTYHALSWAVTGGNLVFSASCSSGTISVKGAALLIKA